MFFFQVLALLDKRIGLRWLHLTRRAIQAWLPNTSLRNQCQFIAMFQVAGAAARKRDRNGPSGRHGRTEETLT